MKYKELPSLEYLNECFMIDFDNGILYWKKRPLEHFKNIHWCNLWNSKNSGNIAGYLNKNGYIVIAIDKKIYLAHRILYYMYFTKIDSYKEIDHKNRIRSDNRIVNLRIVDKSLNMKNINIQKNNTSGYTNISFDKSREKWHVRININGKCKTLGRFKDLDFAIKIRDKAAKENNYLN